MRFFRRKTLYGIVTIGALLLYNLHIIDRIMARYGDYLFNSYAIHEMLFYMPYISIIMLSSILINYLFYKEKENNKLILLVLAIFIIAIIVQSVYFIDRSKHSTTLVVSEIVEIDESGNSICVDIGNGRVRIKCPSIVIGVLDFESEYGISYEWKSDDPYSGRLINISVVKKD